MNNHVSEAIRKKWPQYEFKGLPANRPNGKTYIRAEYKFWPWKGQTHIYCFEDDFFWHETPMAEVP